MALFSRTVTINAGAALAPAKRIRRIFRVQSGASDVDTRHPRQVASVDADATMAVETAALFKRTVAASAESGMAYGPLKVRKVLQISAGAALRTRIGGEGVNSYLTLRSSVLDAEGFLEVTRHGPQGYGKFERVYPGEYVFKDAVVRSVMLTREPTTKPSLTRLKPIVDVPDRILQGSITVTDALAGAVLAFDPAFYTTPEVAVLWQAGSTIGLAYATAATREGVTIYIEDAANPGTRITGTVSYMVQGY